MIPIQHELISDEEHKLGNGSVDNDATDSEHNQQSDQSAERYSVSGYISKLLIGDDKCGRSAPDRQYFYINSRPVDLPKLAKMVNEVYR